MDRANSESLRASSLPEQAAAHPSGPSAGDGRELSSPSQDRRSSRRHSYPYWQNIAPIVRGRLPDGEEFVQVECLDLSAGGFAFYFDHLPAFEELVLLLGHPPQVSKIVCRVVRVALVKRGGREEYLIGCRFIGRCG